jgi:predicted DNA binding CopG/RHH family protein
MRKVSLAVVVFAGLICIGSCEKQDRPIQVQIVQDDSFKIEPDFNIELLRIELRQEELTLAHRKDRLEALTNLDNIGAVPASSVRDAKYEYEMQKLKVEFKRTDIRLKEEDLKAIKKRAK